MGFHKLRRGAIGLTAALICATLATPAASAGEKPATGADSNLPKWSVVDGTRFTDVARRTDRVTYPDAGTVPPVSCDIDGDDLTDMIFTNPTKHKTYMVPFIPYGSDTDEVTRNIEDQDSAKAVSEEAEGYGIASACLPDSTRIAVAAKNKVFIYAAGLKKAAEIDLPNVSAIAGSGNRLAVAAGNKLYFYDATGQIQGKPIDLGAKIEVVAALTDGTFAVGMPAVGKVLIVEPRSGAVSATITGSAESRFGAAITSTGDLNGDENDDLAIGAPMAGNETGSVALITDLSKDVKVDVTSRDAKAVTADGKQVGYLLRAPLRAKLGSSLAWVDGGDKPGALVIGKPVDEEHTGALVISQEALNKNYNSGRGIDGIGEKYKLWLAGGDEKDDVGVAVGVMPRRGEDSLSGIFTVNSTGKVDVWTIDLTRQGELKNDKIEPPVPAPQPEKRAPAVKPVDTEEKKIWMGEFSSGLGSSLAKGRCDVTGDGKADIIAGMPTRSEWKFDPFYMNSTPTYGWLPNVTGGVQIIPGGTRGKEVPAKDTIALNGPKETADPGTDSSVGLSVACLGDTNGDGIDDLAFNSHTMARAWVVYGGKDLGKVDLNHLQPRQGWWIDLPEYGSSPVQISRAGDTNGDGLADLAVTVGNASLAAGQSGQRGALFVFAGQKNGTNVDMKQMKAPAARVLKTIYAPDGHLLNQAAPIGDANGDGMLDWVLTDFQSEGEAGIYPGKAWVVYGSKEPQVHVGANNSFELTMAPGASHRLGAGTSVAPVGDANGDGLADFVIGYDGGQIQHQSEGGVLLVYGCKERRSKQVVSVADGAKNQGVRVVRGLQKGSGFGWAVDALATKKRTLIAVGAPTAKKDGRVYLFDLSLFKQTPTTLPLPKGGMQASGSKVKVLVSTGEQARFGRAVGFVGDVLGGPTLAVGADGVISEEGEGREGFANSAHVLALRVLPPEAASPQPDATAADEGGHPAPGKGQGPQSGGHAGPAVPAKPAPGSGEHLPGGGKDQGNTGKSHNEAGAGERGPEESHPAASGQSPSALATTGAGALGVTALTALLLSLGGLGLVRRR